MIKRPIMAWMRRARGDMTRTSCPIRHWPAGPSQPTRIAPGLPSSSSVSLAQAVCGRQTTRGQVPVPTARDRDSETTQADEDGTSPSSRSFVARRIHHHHHPSAAASSPTVVQLISRRHATKSSLVLVQLHNWQAVLHFPHVVRTTSSMRAWPGRTQTRQDTTQDGYRRPDEGSPVSATGAAGTDPPTSHPVPHSCSSPVLFASSQPVHHH